MKKRSRSDHTNRVRADLARLVSWAENKGIDFRFTHKVAGGEYWEDDNKILINSKLGSKKKLIYLLHELGHRSVHIDGLTKVRYTGNGPVDNFSDRLAILDEEFEAWSRGLALAKKLRITVPEQFWTVRRNSMKRYVIWISQKLHHGRK